MTRLLGVLRSVPLAAAIAAAALLVIAGVVMASGPSSPLTVCVPAKEGKPIITRKGGVCKTGYTLTEVGKEGPEGKQGPEGGSGLGTWTAVALSGKVQQVAGYEPPAVRTEYGGATARLRGAIEVTSEIQAGETVVTIPTPDRPQNKVEFGAGVSSVGGSNHVGSLLISPTGAVTDPETPVPPGIYYLLDGTTWNLQLARSDLAPALIARDRSSRTPWAASTRPRGTPLARRGLAGARAAAPVAAGLPIAMGQTADLRPADGQAVTTIRPSRAPVDVYRRLLRRRSSLFLQLKRHAPSSACRTPRRPPHRTVSRHGV